MEGALRGDLEGVRDEMSGVLDEVDGVQENVVTLEDDVEQVRSGISTLEGDVGSISSQAELASQRSAQVARAYLDAIVAERARVVQRLDELDALIQSWQGEIAQLP